MTILKDSVVSDPQIESLFKKVFTRAQPTEHRYFTAAPTTDDIQTGEVVLAYHDTAWYIYANFDGTIKKVELT